jgi:hypothetical protein
MYFISLKIKLFSYLKSRLGDLAFCPPIILVDSDKGVPATEEDSECRHCIIIRIKAELRRLLWSLFIGVYNLNSFDLAMSSVLKPLCRAVSFLSVYHNTDS